MFTTKNLVIALAGTCVAASVASADVSMQILRVTARDQTTGFTMTHAFVREAGALDPNALHEWTLPQVPELWNTGNDGVVSEDDWGWSGGVIQINQDPVVSLTFNVAAGASNTLFSFDSALVSFSTIGNLQAVASAAITVTESGLFRDGAATIQGGFSNKAFQARIDNNTFTFASLIDSGTLPIAVNGSNTFSDQSSFSLQPVVGHTTATSISSHFSFILSARDRAAGTSTFEIIPAPGAFSLIAAGGLLAARRRR